jgi:BlaI family penicillinase repressor
MANNLQLAVLLLAILMVLWERSEATVSEVRQALAPDRELAHTTVGTMLSKMEEKGHVRHRSDGRVNIYRPVIGRDQVSQSMVSDLAERLFSGNIKQMVCHLLDDGELTAEDLAELRKLIRQREKELKE